MATAIRRSMTHGSVGYLQCVRATYGPGFRKWPLRQLGTHVHSERRASVGFTRMARNAGMYVAVMAAVINSIATDA
jgi:hypothetical protein